jgi:preprotein translocase SecF subunit
VFQILKETKIPFLKHRKMFYLLSGTLIAATLGWMLIHGGPRYSVDFTGGTLLQIRTLRVIPEQEIRSVLGELNLEGAEVQALGRGDEFLIRLPGQVQGIVFSRIAEKLSDRHPDIEPELRREEAVGAKVGKELRSRAFWAVVVSLASILIYVGVRHDLKFAVGAILALLHDVLGALGILMFLGGEVSLTVLAALLTIAGYSINDTIVIFARISERTLDMRRADREAVINTAINETLSRTLITSLTVVLSTLSLFLFGGEVLRDFALCLLAGLVLGTYSTIYVATGLAFDIGNWSARRRARHA